MAAIVYRGPMAKFFSWTIFLHDFELYPFDRELSYDFGWVVVMLITEARGRGGKKHRGSRNRSENKPAVSFYSTCRKVSKRRRSSGGGGGGDESC